MAGVARAQPVSEPAPAPVSVTVSATEQPSEPVLSETSARAAGFALRGLGLRSSVARVDGPATNTKDWNGGGELYERGVGVLRLENWSGRYFDEMWIGYGTEGWRYQLSGQFALGAMWLFQRTHGPLLRFAMRGDLRREGGVYSSELRIPGAELGYSWNRGTAQAELIAHAGTTLTGRFNPDGHKRSLQGGTYGASFSLGWNHIRLDGDLSWVAARADLDAVLHARSHLCGLSQDRWGGSKTRKARQKEVGQPPAPPGWALCGDFRALRGRTQGPGVRTEISTQYVVGISVVLGQLGHL
jgi:hypothetical protein